MNPPNEAHQHKQEQLAFELDAMREHIPDDESGYDKFLAKIQYYFPPATEPATDALMVELLKEMIPHAQTVANESRIASKAGLDGGVHNPLRDYAQRIEKQIERARAAIAARPPAAPDTTLRELAEADIDEAANRWVFENMHNGAMLKQEDSLVAAHEGFVAGVNFAAHATDATKAKGDAK